MPRPKGAKNKVGQSAKDNILAVFTRLGGTAQMAEWAKENLTEFYKLYARLIPTEVSAKVEHEFKPENVSESELQARLARYFPHSPESTKPTVQ
jgi:hypothetical protein